MTGPEEITLKVEELKTYFFTRRGVVRAVNGISFEVRQGEILGLVGESGCGKSVTSLSIMRLIPPPGKIVSGKIIFKGENLLEKSDPEMRKIRGRKISMILQDPSTSLNPVITIGNQVAEAIRAKYTLTKTDLWEKVKGALELLRFPAPENRLNDYPHQLSGGMKQRVAGAIALSVTPDLLIADEPTTALDVTIQAQYLQEIRNLQRQFQLSTIFITHNLGIVYAICDRVCVMYAGEIVEQADVDELFANPLHPYTLGLLSSLPRLDRKMDTLATIPGEPPVLLNLSPGCSYSPRCPNSTPGCREKSPPLEKLSKDHDVRCWKAGKGSRSRDGN